MDETVIDDINKAEAMAKSGKYPGKDFLLRMLSLNPFSEEAAHFRAAGRRLAEAMGCRGRVGSSIGVDLAPCPMSCAFCSLGEKWHLFDKCHELSPDTIVHLIRDAVSKGYRQFTLRTTQFYDLEKLCALGKKIRNEVPGEFYLTANSGELSVDDAKALKEAGFTGIYHAIRLREGIDTPFDPEIRVETIKNAKNGGLEPSCGIDPIGVEHTNEELVDRMELYRTLYPRSVCAMRRVSVKGTPKGDMEEVSDERLAQIAAAVRFAGVGRWTNVATHPPTLLAMEAGANVCAVETGANPRLAEPDTDTWRICNQDTAKEMLESAGYEIGRWTP